MNKIVHVEGLALFLEYGRFWRVLVIVMDGTRLRTFTALGLDNKRQRPIRDI